MCAKYNRFLNSFFSKTGVQRMPSTIHKKIKMADNNLEENPPTLPNEDINIVEDQGTSTDNVQNNNTNDEQSPKDAPKTTDSPQDIVDKSRKSAKILLIFVNICTLLCSITLFVVGVIMTINHAKIHEEWHAGYGFWNASIICIVISIVLAGVGSMGKGFNPFLEIKRNNHLIECY